MQTLLRILVAVLACSLASGAAFANPNDTTSPPSLKATPTATTAPGSGGP